MSTFLTHQNTSRTLNSRNILAKISPLFGITTSETFQMDGRKLYEIECSRFIYLTAAIESKKMKKVLQVTVLMKCEV